MKSLMNNMINNLTINSAFKENLSDTKTVFFLYIVSWTRFFDSPNFKPEKIKINE